MGNNSREKELIVQRNSLMILAEELAGELVMICPEHSGIHEKQVRDLEQLKAEWSME